MAEELLGEQLLLQGEASVSLLAGHGVDSLAKNYQSVGGDVT